MAQALYRKYRPRSLDDVVGQKHITDTLKAALKGGKLSHAYLFTGPHGVGKTSVARILAYEVNGMKYGDSTASLDVIEIDGASNRRIEEVRDLRDKVHILPSAGKYKVYIIDEVHMLTKEAFNALLKTLEEPPSHCIFILATTEAHKLPETIVSRTQRYSFRPISTKQLAKSLAKTAKKEAVKVEPSALELLALHGQGSFRDSISLLDQMHSSGLEITADSVREMIGLPPQQQVSSLCKAVEAQNTPNCLKILESLQEMNVNPAAIAKSLSHELRLLLRTSGNYQWVPRLLKDLLEVASSPSPQERLEIAVLEAASRSQDSDSTPGHSAPRSAKTANQTPPLNLRVESKSKARKLSDAKAKMSLEQWPKFLVNLRGRAPSLSLALKHSIPRVEDGQLQLVFEFAIYKNKADKAENRKLIAESCLEALGASLPIRFMVDKELFRTLKADFLELNTKLADESARNISNIFGGGEVLESSVSI